MESMPIDHWGRITFPGSSSRWPGGHHQPNDEDIWSLYFFWLFHYPQEGSELSSNLTWAYCVQSEPFLAISINNCVLKILGRLVDKYIRDGALMIYPVLLHQSTYQTGSSVEAANHVLVYRKKGRSRMDLLLWEISWALSARLTTPPLGSYAGQPKSIGWNMM
jgi:hypothetical protein